MSHSNSLKTLRDEARISNHVAFTHLNSPSVVELSNGMLISVLKVEGHAFDTETNETLNHIKQTWHRSLCALDEKFSIHVTVHRKKHSSKLEGEFNNEILRDIDKRYSELFSEKVFFNDIYISLIYKGITTGKSSLFIKYIGKLTDKSVKDARSHRRTKQMESLTKATRQLKETLSAFKPHLLGEHDYETGHSELLAFMSLFLNAGTALKIKGTCFPSISKSIPESKSKEAIYPRGRLAQYLSRNRIIFGKYIQIQGQNEYETKYACMLSVKGYPASTASIVTDSLLKLNCEFLTVNTFSIESKELTQDRIKKHMIKMEAIEDPAVSQIQELNIARDQIQSDEIKMGYHHSSVMLISESIEKLDNAAAKVIKKYLDAGIVAVRETLGQEPCFWAQIPGNLKYIARSAMISSLNFVDFAPLHNYRQGYCHGNHLGSAMALSQTPSNTPFYLNLHAQGAQDNPSPGHTVMIGGNGSGKTVAMCFSDAQLSRYGGRSVFFDRNQGCEIYIRACGGYYGILSPDYADQINLNPLQLDDTDSNRSFCKQWINQLVLKEGELEIDDISAKELGDCIDYCFEKLAKEERNLTNATRMLSIKFPRRSRLEKWLRGVDGRPDGEYAYLFDNEMDALSNAVKIGYDMTHFLDNEPPNVLSALSMYLFHCLEASLDGKLVSVFMDEGWQYLDNPYWKSKLRTWLPTLRKNNCHIVLATQSPKSVVDSEISHVILDNAATKIFFANPQAKESHYIDGFNLTHAEFECIKNTPQLSRYFVYKQANESNLCRFNLSDMSQYLKVFSATKKSIKHCHKLIQEKGDAPSQWLCEFMESDQ